MRRWWCALMIGPVAGGLVAATTPSRAQAPGPNPTAAVTDSAYAPRYRFTPVYTNRINADVSSVGMGNDFHTGLFTPWGSIFDFAISLDEKNYRLQNREERNKMMRLTDVHTFSPNLNGSVSAVDSRVFNRSIAVGGGVQDFVFNDKSLNLNTAYRKAYDNLRVDWAGAGSAVNGERAFKRDRTLAAGVNGGVGYNFGDHITWQGRGALRGTRDRSSTIDTTFTGLGSREDSLMTGIRVLFADSIRFDGAYREYHGDRDFTDQARGSLGGQISGAENVFLETEMRDTRNTTVSLDSYVFKRLNMKVSAMHDEQVFEYAVQTTRFSRTVSDGVSGTVKYILPWKTASTVQFENTSTLRDLGPQSIASLTDKRKRVLVGLSHQFSKTFSMDFSGSSQIQQSFYLKYDENPRDRDQVDSSLNLRFRSQPFKKVSASVSLVYSNSKFVNIDATQSENNRTRELYELRPAFTYVVNEHLLIIQNYGLAIEYTDYAYKDTENFLDRNLTFSNEFQYRPTKTIDFRFEYGLLLHDAGSYLPDPVTGERLLDVNSEDRRDRTRIRVDYRPSKSIGFFAENLYSRREDRTPGSDEVDATTDGSIQVGTSANYDWGGGRSLKLLVSRMKRFSPFGADAEKDYWDARSEFAYPF